MILGLIKKQATCRSEVIFIAVHGIEERVLEYDVNSSSVNILKSKLKIFERVHRRAIHITQEPIKMSCRE